MVTCGAFRLRERRPYERTVVSRNPHYYEAGLVTLDEITFIPVADAAAGLNLYRTNSAHAMTGDRLPPLFTSRVGRKKDVYSVSALFHIHPFFNCRKPPLDNVLLRYAMNMATDKEEMADAFGKGRTPAKTAVPRINGYEPPEKIMMAIGERHYDVLSYNPAAARELLARAGFPNGIGHNGVQLSFEYLIPDLPHSLPMAEILQQQWHRNLNLPIKIVSQELTAFINTVISGQFAIAEDGCGDYQDPNTFLGVWETGAPLSAAWSAPEYDAMMRTANSEVLPIMRLKELRRCEEYLLRAMPLVPLLFYGYAGFQKPYVRGLGTNFFDVHPFKYTWIDTKWRPS
jgi:ABC-type oligopeptide transport system substrate-binding subunit